MVWWCQYLESVGPRLVRVQAVDPPLGVFTDGCCDEGFTGVGAVLIHGDEVEYFGAQLDPVA
eukprot:11061895-Alexandrium_andersonii.AAC.1